MGSCVFWLFDFGRTTTELSGRFWNRGSSIGIVKLNRFGQAVAANYLSKKV